MKRFDAALAADALERLGRLSPDAKPRWGKMTLPELLGHLAAATRMSMGDLPELPYRGSFVSRHIFRHLIVNQIVAIPRGVKVPRPAGAPKDFKPPAATLDELRAVFDGYLGRIAKGTLPTVVHPFFGPLPPAAWRKFHAAHLRHHLSQFGVGEGF